MDFVNGKTSWLETHFEIVAGIQQALKKKGKNIALQRQEQQGTGGLYELSEELTDKFETEYENKVWDGEFFEVIEKFIEDYIFAKP